MCVHDLDLEVSNVGFLPIVSAYATRLGLAEEIDRLLDCKMEVSPGMEEPGHLPADFFHANTKFIGTFVLAFQGQRRLAKPLSTVQLQYQQLPDLTPDVFLTPWERPKPKKARAKKN